MSIVIEQFMDIPKKYIIIVLWFITLCSWLYCSLKSPVCMRMYTPEIKFPCWFPGRYDYQISLTKSLFIPVGSARLHIQLTIISAMGRHQWISYIEFSFNLETWRYIWTSMWEVGDCFVHLSWYTCMSMSMCSAGVIR